MVPWPQSKSPSRPGCHVTWLPTFLSVYRDLQAIYILPDRSLQGSPFWLMMWRYSLFWMYNITLMRWVDSWAFYLPIWPSAYASFSFPRHFELYTRHTVANACFAATICLFYALTFVLLKRHLTITCSTILLYVSLMVCLGPWWLFDTKTQMWIQRTIAHYYFHLIPSSNWKSTCIGLAVQLEAWLQASSG